MPCWTTASSQINLQNANRELLKAALAAIGFTNLHENDEYARMRGNGAVLTMDRFADSTSVTVMANGTVTVTSARADRNMTALGNEVKRAYSGQVIQSAAKRFGWMLKPQDETGRKFSVMGRG